MANNDYGMRVKYKPVVDPKVFNDAIKKLEGQVKHLPIHLKINNYSEIRQKLGTLRGEFKALQKIAENINIPQANVNNLITQQNNNNSGSKGSDPGNGRRGSSMRRAGAVPRVGRSGAPGRFRPHDPPAQTQ